jgi:hypothetical protein
MWHLLSCIVVGIGKRWDIDMRHLDFDREDHTWVDICLEFPMENSRHCTHTIEEKEMGVLMSLAFEIYQFVITK